MKKQLKVRVWQLILFFVIIIVLHFVLREQKPHVIASRKTGLDIPSNSTVMYSKDWNKFIPAGYGYDFVFKIPEDEDEIFSTQLINRNYSQFSDTTIIIHFDFMGHADTLRNGFKKYRSIKEYYYYDSDKRLFFYHNVDY